MMRICPEMRDYPVCILTDRVNTIHGKNFYTLKTPLFWGYFIYLPDLQFGFNQVDKFVDIFSPLGKIIL